MLGKFWNKLKDFWKRNLLNKYKKVSAKLSAFISSMLMLFVPVVRYYSYFIPIIVWQEFIYGAYLTTVVLINAILFYMMQNGNGNGNGNHNQSNSVPQ